MPHKLASLCIQGLLRHKIGQVLVRISNLADQGRAEGQRLAGAPHEALDQVAGDGGEGCGGFGRFLVVLGGFERFLAVVRGFRPFSTGRLVWGKGLGKARFSLPPIGHLKPFRNAKTAKKTS